MLSRSRLDHFSGQGGLTWKVPEGSDSSFVPAGVGVGAATTPGVSVPVTGQDLPPTLRLLGLERVLRRLSVHTHDPQDVAVVGALEVRRLVREEPQSWHLLPSKDLRCWTPRPRPGVTAPFLWSPGREDTRQTELVVIAIGVGEKKENGSHRRSGIFYESP